MTTPVLARTSTGAMRLPMAQVSGSAAVADRIFHRLRTDRGTALEDDSRGLPWFGPRHNGWLLRKNVPRIEIEGTVREQVALVDGVVSVDSVLAERVNDGLVVSVACTVKKDDEISSITITVADPYQTSGPPTWFAIAGLMW